MSETLNQQIDNKNELLRLKQLPEIEDYYTDEYNILHLTLAKCNISMANAIRRIILSEIPTAVIKTYPYKNKDIDIQINTSKLNNEILKQRLSCIPIHIKNLDILNTLTLELDVINDTKGILYVTTADIRIKDENGKYLSENETRKIFPMNKKTKEFIIINRLRPEISNDIPGEHVKFISKLSKGISKEHGGFNVVSTCSYRFTPDDKRISELILDKQISLSEEGKNDTEIKNIIQNWKNHDAKRVYIQDSYDFIIETVGVYTNEEILYKAIAILIKKFETIKENIKNNIYNFNEHTTTMENCVDIELKNEDYTTGKVIEYILHEIYFQNEKILSYVGFIQLHPHDDYSILRLVFNNIDDFNTNNIKQLIINACNIANETFNNIHL